MTKIDIISGFLGAGKTTLIKKLLKEAFGNEKLVLIENEFGEIGIDGGFLKEAGVQITEMNSGCICCSLVGDFGTALKEVYERFSPDRIIIEPSGVGKLSDVIRAVQNVEKDVPIELNSFVTIADVSKCKMYMKNFGEFYNNQIEHARTIILSRTQNVSAEKLETCVKKIKEHNKNATIITTPWEELDGKKIIAAMEKKESLIQELLEEEEICPCCGHHHSDEDHHHEEHHHDHEHECHEDHHHEDHECHEAGHHHEDNECHEDHHHEDHDCHEGHHHDHDHHHHADDVFSSWGVETPHKYSEDEVRRALELFSKSDDYGTILRAKGILPSKQEEWIYFDYVPGELEIRSGAPEVTGRLCVIGTNIKPNLLEELFSI